MMEEHNRKMRHLHWPLLNCYLCLGIWLVQGQATRAAEPRFSRDVQPILSEYCYRCHGPDEGSREADLRLDERDSLMLAVGEPGDSEDSELLRRISTNDPDEIMPPLSAKHALGLKDIETIRAWILSGAKWEDHWSFVPPVRPELPQVDHALLPLVRNQIDLFVLAKLSQARLTPNPMAKPERLIRRVTLDLTGLPPTIEAANAFLAAPDVAYDDLVERLLASPRFGERMAMDWLDAARYADTNGYQGDNERTMWPWRDWVVAAFNRNMPYDEFTVWQLAGDMLPNATEEHKLATGFCRNHMINGEGGRIAEENRVEYIFDQIETVGTVWMGLTLQCCRCHDHKFDPLLQRDYFQLFAYFNQTPVNGGGGDPQMPPNLLVVPELAQDELNRLRTATDNAYSLLQAAEQAIEPGSRQLSEEAKAVLMVAASQRTDDQWKLLIEQAGEYNAKLTELMRTYQTRKRELDQTLERLPKVMVMQDHPPKEHRETFILTKGLYNQREDKVRAATPKFLPGTDGARHDRLSLAHWLVSDEQPLTARVTVNRIWQMFFGTGLVKTAEDFGVQGEKPSHAELLDWLAVEFVESGWDIKHLIRLIVSSSTYRQSASTSPTQLEKDAENRLLSRASRQRMPAWMIRDHALFISGIATGELGGPSVKPYQPAGVWADASFGNKKYQQDSGEKLYRRSLYTYWRRIVGPTMFFDMARRQTCSVRTSQTNTPLHALITLNDTTYVEAARLLAQRVMRAEQDSDERLSLAFRLATGRKPTTEEVELIESRLQRFFEKFESDGQAVKALLDVGEAPVPTDAKPSELASYTTVCLMILNLDETLTK